MKSKKVELEVDIIGSQSGLTPLEEKALGEYFAKKKQVATRRLKKRVAKRTKVIS